MARVDARSSIRPGDEVELCVEMERIHLFDPDDEHSIILRPPEPTPGPILEVSEPETSSDGATTEVEQVEVVEETRETIEAQTIRGEA